MKLKSIIITGALILCGISGLIGWSDHPADEGEIKREKADKIMCQTYGQNWFDIFVASEKINPAQVKAMAATYKLAIGYQPTR